MNASPCQASGSAQKGFSLIEILMALILLSLGSGSLWYLIQSGQRVEAINRRHHFAIEAARNEMESLRSFSKEDVRDSAYLLDGSAGELLLRRVVLDSVKLVETLDELILDENYRPIEWFKPLELQVEVWQLDQPYTEGRSPEGRILFSLNLLKPEYAWH